MKIGSLMAEGAFLVEATEDIVTSATYKDGARVTVYARKAVPTTEGILFTFVTVDASTTLDKAEAVQIAEDLLVAEAAHIVETNRNA